MLKKLTALSLTALLLLLPFAVTHAEEPDADALPEEQPKMLHANLTDLVLEHGVAGAKEKLKEQGFPPELVDDLDDYLTDLKRRNSGEGEMDVSSDAVPTDGILTRPMAMCDWNRTGWGIWEGTRGLIVPVFYYLYRTPTGIQNRDLSPRGVQPCFHDICGYADALIAQPQTRLTSFQLIGSGLRITDATCRLR